jgi:hypothetical protein
MQRLGSERWVGCLIGWLGRPRDMCDIIRPDTGRRPDALMGLDVALCVMKTAMATGNPNSGD